MFKISLAMLLLSAAPAYAQWHYQGEESAFGGKGIHVALTGNRAYSFGIRCEDGETQAILLTPEDLQASDAEAFSIMRPTMLLRIDDSPALDLATSVDSTSGKLRALADVDLDFVQQLKNAKRRVAVAISMGGERYWSAP